jgi:hypothetical protein
MTAASASPTTVAMRVATAVALRSDLAKQLYGAKFVRKGLAGPAALH